MTPGQMDIDECISIAENTCEDCPDPGTCQAENACCLDIEPGISDEAGWDEI